MWPWKKAERELLKAVTSMGEFTRWSDNRSGLWEGCVTVNGVKITVLTEDADGKPDPCFLAQVPIISQDLAALKSIALEDIPELRTVLTEEHCVDAIGPGDEAGFWLDFLRENEDWEYIIYVMFKGQSAVDWYSLYQD